MENTIKLAYMYPDILNLHGDRGNVLAFERIAEMMGIDLEVERIDSPSDKIDFSEYDIIVLSPGELKVMKTVAESLGRQKEELEKYIESEKYLFAIGTTAAAFVKDIKRDTEEDFTGLGLFDATATERKMIYGDDLIFTTEVNGEEMEIVSCQINSVDITYRNSTAFGNISYGYGNDRTGTEGARIKNLILTNALGPVFIKNPWLTKAVLEDCAVKKGIEIKNPDLDFSLEEASKKAITEFAKMKDPV